MSKFYLWKGLPKSLKKNEVRIEISEVCQVRQNFVRSSSSSSEVRQVRQNFVKSSSSSSEVRQVRHRSSSKARRARQKFVKFIRSLSDVRQKFVKFVGFVEGLGGFLIRSRHNLFFWILAAKQLIFSILEGKTTYFALRKWDLTNLTNFWRTWRTFDEVLTNLTNFWRNFDELLMNFRRNFDELLMNFWRTWRTSDELDEPPTKLTNLSHLKRTCFPLVVVKSQPSANVFLFSGPLWKRESDLTLAGVIGLWAYFIFTHFKVNIWCFAAHSYTLNSIWQP